jgi:hypothetical protein
MGAEWTPRRLTWQVKQHEYKQVEDQNGARVHNDLHACQEFCTHKQEYACDVQKEGENPQHAMGGISASHG